MLRLSSTEEPSNITEKLVTTYRLQVPKDVIVSTFANQPKLPVLLSRASFRPSIDDRTEQRTREQRERRHFLRSVLALTGFSVAALVLLEIGSPFGEPAETQASAPSGPPQPSTVSNPSTQNGTLLANASNIPPNQSMSLNDPTVGPILLIHLDNGQFVAYSSICTHAGCQVQFDPSFKDIACPCHGAMYDPYNGAQVIRGPARYPLQKIPIQYDQSTGNIYLTG